MGNKQFEVVREELQTPVSKMLFVGLEKKGDVNKLKRILDTRLDGYTLFSGSGAYKGKSEPSVTIVISGINYVSYNDLVKEIKQALNQECLAEINLNKMELV